MAPLLPSMRIKFSNAADRFGVSAGGVFACSAGGVAGAAAAGCFFASRCASRSCSATISWRNSPSVVNGRPWDIEQTQLTLRTYLIEEAYEVLEALESGDDAKFAEELGDLLLQVVFHAQIASEEKLFTAADVVREIHQKMVRRHPHVFGEKRARDAKEVLKNWEQIKAEERRAKEPGKGTGLSVETAKAPDSLLDGIPHTLPAVMQGFQLTRRASRIGFDWDNVEGVVEKLQEELAE